MNQMDIAMDPMAGCGASKVCGILAIDPGPDQSGWCVLYGDMVVACGVMPNDEVLQYVQRSHFKVNATTLAIEAIASYGMAVGQEIFDTCIWIGRFIQAWADPDAVKLVYRKDVKLQICGTHKAKDANIRQALLDRFPRSGGGKVPQVGTKKKPGPLYGVSTHVWPALAVAITVQAKGEGKC